MSENTPSADANDEVSSTGAGPSLGRRRLLRGGLAAGPVVVASAMPRSVMAGECVPASSFASINASRPAGHTEYSCVNGRTPGYWKNPVWFPQWPAPYTPYPPGYLFNTAFPGSTGYPGLTLLQVLELMDGGREAVARHIVAALLNAQKGWTPGAVASTTIVKQVWMQYDTLGYYEPTAGIKWYHDYSVPSGVGGIIPWLLTTMPA